jgi:hypothetical protein
LRRRKNKQGGSVLNRGCWCKQCKVTCPVHRLLELCANLQAGDKVCRGLCAKRALGLLRKSLTDLGVDNAGQYRTHDLRRGHAQASVLHRRTSAERPVPRTFCRVVLPWQPSWPLANGGVRHSSATSTKPSGKARQSSQLIWERAQTRISKSLSASASGALQSVRNG